MNGYFKIVYMGCLLAVFGCGEDSTADGTLNGNCRLSQTQCDDGLTCREGICQAPIRDPFPNLDIAVELLSRDLVADGEDSLDFQVLINDTDTNEPYSGELLVVAQPSGVGQVTPGLLNIEDGFGFGTYRSCDRRSDFPCPEIMSLALSHPESPLNPIFETDVFRQLSPPITAPTSIQMGNCRSEVGSEIGVTVPFRMGEKVEIDSSNPINGPTATKLILNASNLSLEVPLPDQATDQYQALSPDQVSILIVEETSSTEEASDIPTPTSSCLANGVWVGSQRLEFWSEESDEGFVEHVMSNIELDCFDDRGGYSVVRVCAHGTR